MTFDTAFQKVITACASNREGGTWILPEMLLAYTQLHQLGHAHSFEVWHEGQLAGGLYGVRRGALFAAESMFHVVTDAFQGGAHGSARHAVPRRHPGLRRAVS